MLYLKTRLWLSLMLVHCFPLFILALPPHQSEEPQKGQAGSTRNEYVTSATCSSCHEDLLKQFARNPHQVLEIQPKKGWQERSCESCHGPGQAHVEAGDGSQIVAFNNLSPKETNSNCLKCHARAETQAGSGTSLHGRSQLACTQCHRIHEVKQVVHLLADKPDPLCLSCHGEAQAAFNKPYRHRLQEGAIHCVDCHEQHGGLQPHQTKVSFGNEATCVKCHTDKRGPFAFEHPPMRLEGCMGCHEPHGSVNPKMLIRHEQRFLCLECHSAAPELLASQPPSFHDLRSARFQNCTTCHLRVHGSNVNQFLLH
jgi:DmsE family decaheme c-type cytochrome